VTIQSETLVSLKSMKAQLEVGQIYLKRRHGELVRQLAAVEGQAGTRGTIHPDALAQLQRTVQEHAVQIERRNLEIQDIEERIRALQNQSERSGTALLSEQNQVTAEIAEIRIQILAALRQLAGPLQQYEQLAERKNRLADEISAKTGRNQAYVNYIESALFRQTEYIDDVRYVVEALKRQRVVA
jgi:chromosome segregation ATPase